MPVCLGIHLLARRVSCSWRLEQRDSLLAGALHVQKDAAVRHVKGLRLGKFKPHGNGSRALHSRWLKKSHR